MGAREKVVKMIIMIMLLTDLNSKKEQVWGLLLEEAELEHL